MRSLFFLFAIGSFGVVCWAQTPSINIPNEASVWQAAVAHRAASFTLAPGEMPYEQYHIDKKNIESNSETGRLSLAYDRTGKATISVIWAKRGENDFTAQRAERLEKQVSRINDVVYYLTPFDPTVQSKLERKSGRRIFADGKALWEYEFRLPVDKKRSYEGTARVSNNGKPYDFSFSISPKPFYLDTMNVRITFNADGEYLIFDRISFIYKASFLFWSWNGGGDAGFDNWKWISAPPRFN